METGTGYSGTAAGAASAGAGGAGDSHDGDYLDEGTARTEAISRIVSVALEHGRAASGTLGFKTSYAMVQHPSGFEVTESSACVRPEDYSEEIGVGIARERIEEKLWEVEGFLSQMCDAGLALRVTPLFWHALSEAWEAVTQQWSLSKREQALRGLVQAIREADVVGDRVQALVYARCAAKPSGYPHDPRIPRADGVRARMRRDYTPRLIRPEMLDTGASPVEPAGFPDPLAAVAGVEHKDEVAGHDGRVYRLVTVTVNGRPCRVRSRQDRLAVPVVDLIRAANIAVVDGTPLARLAKSPSTRILAAVLDERPGTIGGTVTADGWAPPPLAAEWFATLTVSNAYVDIQRMLEEAEAEDDDLTLDGHYEHVAFRVERSTEAPDALPFKVYEGVSYDFPATVDEAQGVPDGVLESAAAPSPNAVGLLGSFAADPGTPDAPAPEQEAPKTVGHIRKEHFTGRPGAFFAMLARRLAPEWRFEDNGGRDLGPVIRPTGEATGGGPGGDDPYFRPLPADATGAVLEKPLEMATEYYGLSGRTPNGLDHVLTGTSTYSPLEVETLVRRGVPLAVAIRVCASTCSRCGNALLHELTDGRHGFPYGGPKWREDRTRCGFCMSETDYQKRAQEYAEDEAADDAYRQRLATAEEKGVAVPVTLFDPAHSLDERTDLRSRERTEGTTASTGRKVFGLIVPHRYRHAVGDWLFAGQAPNVGLRLDTGIVPFTADLMRTDSERGLFIIMPNGEVWPGLDEVPCTGVLFGPGAMDAVLSGEGEIERVERAPADVDPDDETPEAGTPQADTPEDAPAPSPKQPNEHGTIVTPSGDCRLTGLVHGVGGNVLGFSARDKKAFSDLDEGRLALVTTNRPDGEKVSIQGTIKRVLSASYAHVEVPEVHAGAVEALALTFVAHYPGMADPTSGRHASLIVESDDE